MIIYVNPGGITVNGTQYLNTYSVGRYLFMQLDSAGTIENATYLQLTGTVSDLSWYNTSEIRAYVNPATDTTKFLIQMDLEAAGVSTPTRINFDFTNQTSNKTAQFIDWMFYQVYYSMTPIYASTTSTSNTTTLKGRGCGLQSPGLKPPQIYAALPEGPNAIRLYFTDADKPYDHYTLAFGTDASNMQYGALNIGGVGTRTYLVDHLAPYTNYYFKIRAGNDCAPGDWSNIYSAITTPFLLSQTNLTNSQEQLPTPTTAFETQSPTPSPSASVKVLVIDQNKQKVIGATVMLLPDQQTIISNDQGEVVFNNLKTGEYQLIVNKDTAKQQLSFQVNQDTNLQEFTVELQNLNKNLNTPNKILRLILTGTLIFSIVLFLKNLFMKKSFHLPNSGKK